MRIRPALSSPPRTARSRAICSASTGGRSTCGWRWPRRRRPRSRRRPTGCCCSAITTTRRAAATTSRSAGCSRSSARRASRRWPASSGRRGGGRDERRHPLPAAKRQLGRRRIRRPVRRAAGDRAGDARPRLPLDVPLLRALPAQQPGRRPHRPREEILALGGRLDRRVADRLSRPLRLGRRSLPARAPPAGRGDRHLRRRQAMDVEDRASRRPARDQRAACRGRPAGAAGDGLAGRDPRLLRTGLPAETGRRPGPLCDAVVRPRPDRRLPALLLAILRHRPCRDGRHGQRDEQRRFSEMAGRQRHRRQPGEPRRGAVPPARLQRLPRPDLRGGGAGPRRALRARRRGARRRRLHPRRHPRTGQAPARRLSDRDAVLCRPARRGADRRPPRLYQGASPEPAMTVTTVAELPHERGGSYLTDGTTLASWLLTRDHKRIAILYTLTITAFFFIGGAAAAVIRLNLLTPEGTLVDAATYNRIFTLHGVVMVWLFLVPSIPTTFGNFLIPLMLGAKDLAFPRLNLLSWYLFVASGLIVLAGLIGGSVDTGWTFYEPLSSGYASGALVVVLLGIFVNGFSSILTGLNFVVSIHRLRAPGLTWYRLPIFCWSNYATAVIMMLATPVLAVTLMLVAVEHL